MVIKGCASPFDIVFDNVMCMYQLLQFANTKINITLVCMHLL